MIGFAGAVALSEVLKTNTTLDKINLNRLTKGLFNGEQVFGNEEQRKTVNGIGNEGAKVLFEALEENTTLTKLDLRGEGKRGRRERK